MFIGIAYEERASQWKGIDLRLLWKQDMESNKRWNKDNKRISIEKKRTFFFSEIREKKMTEGLITLEVKDRI